MSTGSRNIGGIVSMVMQCLPPSLPPAVLLYMRVACSWRSELMFEQLLVAAMTGLREMLLHAGDQRMLLGMLHKLLCSISTTT